jgi:phage shock protein E
MGHEDYLQRAAEAKTRIKQVSTDEAEKIAQQPDALVLDVREDPEYQQGHIPEATNVSLNQLEQKIHDLAPDPSTPIICYCMAGNRGALAADALNNMGYTNVVSIEGGLSAWESSGKETEQGTQE